MAAVFQLPSAWSSPLNRNTSTALLCQLSKATCVSLMDTVPIDGPTFQPMCPRAPCILDVFIHVKFQKRAKTRWMKLFSLHFLITPIPFAGIFQGQESFLPTFVNALLCKRNISGKLLRELDCHLLFGAFLIQYQLKICLPKED